MAEVAWRPTPEYVENANVTRFMRRHGITPSQVVTHRFDIEHGSDAFRVADSATTGKVCFVFDP